MGKGAKGAEQEVTEYRLSIHYGICTEADAITRITIGEDKVAWEGELTDPGIININLPQLFGGPTKEGGVAGLVYWLPGRADQIMPDVLARRLGRTNLTCPGFRGIASVFFVGSAESNVSTVSLIGMQATVPGTNGLGGFYWTANSPFIQKASITVRRIPKGLNPATARIGPDANPIHWIYELLTDESFGLGHPDYMINVAGYEAAAQTILDEAFGVSLIWTRQTEVENQIAEMLDHVQATVFVNPQTGLFDIKLVRDDYDLEDVREINPGNARLVKFDRKLFGETTNEIILTWTNPANEQEETISAHDLGAIAASGGVISDSRNYYAIRNAELARTILARDIRSAAAPIALAEVELDRSFWGILPGSVLKFVWPEKKIYDPLVMRVMNISYGKRGAPALKVLLIEDVFSLAKGGVPEAPGTEWGAVDEDAAPMEFVSIFTLPAFLASRELGRSVTSLAYPEVIAGLLTFQEGQDTIAYNLWSEQPLANGELVWSDLGIKSITGRGTMITPVYQEAVSLVDGFPLIDRGRGPEVGGFVVFGSGGDTDSEIALIRAYDADEDAWTLDRGVLDTVPRPWPVDSEVWFIPARSIIADDADPRSVGEEVEYKLITRTSRGQLALDDAPVETGIMTARPYAPLRPANVKVNGVGFGEVDATGAANLTITWATRNRFYEDGIVVPWTDGPVTPEYLQRTVVSIFREDGSPMYEDGSLWVGNELVIPIAWVQQEQRVFVRVSSIREGIASIQSYGLWVKNIPQIVGPAPPPANPPIGDPPAAPPPEPPPIPEPLPPVDPVPPVHPGGGDPGWHYEWNMFQPDLP